MTLTRIELAEKDRGLNIISTKDYPIRRLNGDAIGLGHDRAFVVV